MPICDGCGRQVDAAHIKERIERLEMATRFRPIHIQTLVVDACPPAAIADFFFNAGANAGPRSATGRAHFDELAKCAPDAKAKSASDEIVLSEWQRRGLFLAYAVDCPFESATELAAAVEKAARTLLLRLATSYKPKRVALISAPAAPLVESLKQNGWAEKLILDSNLPFQGMGFGDRLAAAVASA
jgi:hypothetical protein